MVNKILCATAIGSVLYMHHAYTKSVADTVDNILSSERILPEQAMQDQIPTISLSDILHTKVPTHHAHAREIYVVRNTTINGKKGIAYYQADYERDVHASFDIYEGKEGYLWLDARNGGEDFDDGRDDFFEAYIK